MIDLERGIRTVRADWPTARFADTVEVTLNLSTLAAHLSDTRARIEAMLARGVFEVVLASDDGKPLFKMSEMQSYRAAYHAELTRLSNRANGVTFTARN